MLSTWSSSLRTIGTVSPSTTNFTYAQAGSNITGNIALNSPTGKVTAVSATSTRYPGVWAGVITGTDASIVAYQNTSTQPAGMVEVSVDGGPFTSCAISGGKYVLFAGLSQASHLVLVRINSAYSTSANFPNSGTLLSVTGAPPSIVSYSNWVQPGDGNSNTAHTNAIIANPQGAGYTPASVIDNSANAQANISSVAIKGDPTELLIFSRARYFFLSVDGAAGTRYDAGSTATAERMVRITGLSGTHTYYVWTGQQGAYPILSIGGVYSTGISNIATKKRMDQYGDSITAGQGATCYGDTDTFKVAHALGYVGGNYGVSGNTVANLYARMPTILAEKSVTASDVAVLAIGRNDISASWDATRISNYTSMVSSLLTAGYGKVICRGILPEGAQTWTSQNGSIQSIVTGFADSRVVFCDTSSWSGIATSDGTHPTDAGYVTVANYAQPAYVALGA